MFSIHGVVVLIFIIKVVVGVVGQVAQTDGDDGGDVGVDFFRTPCEQTQTVEQGLCRTGAVLVPVVPPDEGLEGLDAVLPQLVVVNVAELHHQRDDLLQILTYKQELQDDNAN